MRKPGVKVCGVTRVEDARLAVELGADLIGLNFWPGSPRFLTIDAARSIVEAIEGRVRTVGVWVNPVREDVMAVEEALSLDLLQFHQDHDQATEAWFPYRVIRALRLGADLESIQLERYHQVWGFLFDCAPSGVYGGTGRSWSYDRMNPLQTSKPVLLAGGLRAENVVAAISQAAPDYVDVCSGIEVEPGIKDPELMKRFFREVRHAQIRE